jgi:GH35 family endo-1,4-beta-xylanase
VAFTDTSTPGEGEFNEIVCWYWAFGPNEGDISNDQHPEYTYTRFGTWYATLLVMDAAGRCSQQSHPVTVELTAPGQADIQHLSDLQNLTSLREMIARHPVRGDFFIGTTMFDGIWYTRPLQWAHMPCDPCGENEEWTERHWDDCDNPHTCQGGDPGRTCGYCNTDPRSLTINYGDLPLESEAITGYLEHEFNMLSTGNSLLHPTIARKAVWTDAAGEGEGEGEGEGGSFTVDYQYGLLDSNFSGPADDMNLRMYGLGPIYWLAAWAAYGAAMGRLTHEEVRDTLLEYAEDVFTHFTEPEEPQFAYWALAQELIRDNPGGASNTLADVLLWDRGFDTWPGTEEDEIERRLWWPWYLLSDPARTGQEPPFTWGAASDTAFAADTLKDIYRLAREFDPDATLVYDDYHIEFRYGQGLTPVDYKKYSRVHILVDELQSPSEGEGEGEGEGEESILDAIALQTHLTTWSCLTYDPALQALRLNPKQLQSIRDSIRGFEDKGLRVILSQMDVRMGIPGGLGDDGLSAHLPGHTLEWTELSVADRSDWQAIVYEAVINAALTVPALSGIIFWDISDETSWLNWTYNNGWPFTEPIPDPGASRACLFGDDPNTPEREMYYPKPAYWGVRNAITNYFGRAFVVRDVEGVEVARFAENGNVLLLKRGAAVTENVTNWAALGLPDDNAREFIVRDREGAYQAVITEDGNLYLAGTVMEYQEAPLQAGEGLAAFKVRQDGEVVSLIDEQGNLKLLGYLLVEGLPYGLPLNNNYDAYHYH